MLPAGAELGFTHLREHVLAPSQTGAAQDGTPSTQEPPSVNLTLRLRLGCSLFYQGDGHMARGRDGAGTCT